MKRAIVIAAASAYVLAAARPDDVPSLIQNGLSKSRGRLAEEERRATRLLDTSTRESLAGNLEQARNIVRDVFRRESESIAALHVLSGSEASKSYLDSVVAEVSGGVRDALVRVERHAETLTRMRGWPGPERQAPPPDQAARLVPVRMPGIRGPVHFFRPQYGRDWMVEKLGDVTFLDEVRLVRFGHYYLYETLNFADGKRNLGEIRERVAAEYGLAPLDEIAEYFRWLEKAGVVSMSEP